MKIPTVADIKKIQKDEKIKRADLSGDYEDARTVISEGIEQMTRKGHNTLHFENVKRLKRVSPSYAEMVLDELQKGGHKIIETESGHQIEWSKAPEPDPEPKT